MKYCYDKVKNAGSVEYKKTTTVEISTKRGSYTLSRTVSEAAFVGGSSLREVTAVQMDREAVFTSFSDGSYRYFPIYEDKYVKSPENGRFDPSLLLPYPEKVSGTAEKVGYDGRDVFLFGTKSDKIKSFVLAELTGSCDVFAYTATNPEDAVFSEFTVAADRDGEMPAVSVEGEIYIKSAGVTASFNVFTEIQSVDSLADVELPMTEEEAAQVGSYSDFIKSLYPIADLISDIQWAVLFGYQPEPGFDFKTFDFDGYDDVLYWDKFLEAVK